MTPPEGTVRRFASARIEHWQALDGRNIRLGPVIGTEEGGPLSAYYARFGAGESAPLPAPYEEVWIVLSGSVTVHTGGTTLTAGPGELLHVPENSPGELRTNEDTELACVSVPAH